MGVAHASPGDVRPVRIVSFDPADYPVPTGREEEWRFTPLRRLRGLHDGSDATSSDAAGSGSESIGSGGTGKVVVEADCAPGVVVNQVGRDDARIGRLGPPDDRVAARAWQGFDRATVVSVPSGVDTGEPTVVTIRGESAEGSAFGHTVIDVAPFARAVVVLDFVGSATYADNVEVVVGDSAQLTVVSLQGWADDAVHLGSHRIRVGRDAKVRHVAVTLGGDVVRIRPNVSYSGPGGDAELLGLYFADAGQHLEHRLFVDHDAPNCTSRVTYKGALQGDGAHVVWIGDVRIRPQATGTDTYEINRNLVLTDGARADSVPNLEIETGEVVGAGHASTTGRFDDEQLFYLQSRGIPEDVARRLVVRGFFTDLLARIGVPEIAARLTGAVDAELERSNR
jgi:Fe-S cluster assembly protein SufD